MSLLSSFIPLGASGYSGYSGKSGYSGTSGISGCSGVSGGTGTSPTTIDITVTAGENLSIRDCVFIAASTIGGITAGRAYKCDADTIRMSSGSFWIGFCVAAITSGATGSVRVAGVMTGFTLTAGQVQYVSATAGAITATEPTNSRIVGIAVSATDLLINNRGANTSIIGTATKGYSTYATYSEIMAVSTETFASNTNIIEPYIQSACVSEGLSKAYLCGATSYGVDTNKVTFATDSSAACTTANLVLGRQQSAGLNANTSKGYILGGLTAASAYTATAEKITYSSDSTASQTTANLSQARAPGSIRGVTAYDSKGYVQGGNTGAHVVTADKVTFSTDSTAASTSANLTAGRSVIQTTSEGTSKGYVMGGNTGDCVVTAEKVTFSSDTAAACTTANCSIARGWGAAFSTGNSYGYTFGGYSSTSGYPYNTVTDRITFSTDTNAARTVANLLSNIGWLKGYSDLAF